MEEPAPIKEIEIPLNDVTTKKDGQANPEGKAPVADTKIAQSKVVRGNKKMRVDSGEFSGTTSEKKGALSIYYKSPIRDVVQLNLYDVYTGFT